jgi:ribosomal protein S18 acetylase RimI-like enzyme
MRRPVTLALWFGLLALPAAALAQQPNNVVLREGSTKQLTPHVWAIFGNPNIAIIVGSKATLVVDTGLGPRNGAFIAGEVAKLRKSAKLFLTTTHGTAAGFAEIAIRPYADGCDSQPVPFLEGIWVKAELRRQGIGARLIKHIETFLTARGFRELGSDTPIDNDASQAAHLGWKFTETERVIYFRKDLDAYAAAKAKNTRV